MTKELKIKRFDPKNQLYARCGMLFVDPEKANGRSTPECIEHYMSKLVAPGVVRVKGPFYAPHEEIENAFSPPRDETLYAAYQEQWQMYEQRRGTNTPPRYRLVVLKLNGDDCVDTLWDRDCMRLFLNGALDGLAVMTLLKNGATRICRQDWGLFDYVFLQWENDAVARRNLYEVYARMMDYETFETLYQTCTQDHGTLVVFPHAYDHDLSKRFFWFKPEDVDELRKREQQPPVPQPQTGERVVREAPITGGRLLLTVDQ